MLTYSATDNYHALLLWFNKFPHYQGRVFYVSGESYGGHYVPTLVDKILEGNKDKNNLYINLQGFLVSEHDTFVHIKY